MNTIDMKKEVLAMALQSFREILFAGTSGNLSVYDPEKNIVAITPSGIPYETMTAEDISVIDLDGNILEGPHKPSSEWRMHTAIYQGLPGTFGVVHTHSPYATSFAVVQKPIPTALIEMISFLGGDVPVADFAMPGTKELGDKAIQVLTHRKACLLANHGVLAVGPTLEKAHLSALYAEDAAKVCSLSYAVGELHLVPLEFQNMMREKYGMKAET